jgi:uncharacterized protein (TIGR01244 family)
MRRASVIGRFALPLLLAFSAVWACAAESVLESLPQHVQLSPGLHASGQPAAEAIAALPASGVKVVIDLRPDEETPGLDEAAVVKQAGLVYENLPVAGKSGLTRANVEAFDALLKKHAGVTVLAHCASGNRVGALLALRAAWLQGKPASEALALGDKAGLKGLRPDVEALLRPAPSPDALPQK